MVVRAPEKRDCVLYVRVSEKNKKFVETQAAKADVSESYFVDAILDEWRKKSNARNKKKAS